MTDDKPQTELSFLLELLLETPDLEAQKEKLIKRIRVVEALLIARPVVMRGQLRPGEILIPGPPINPQAPSTLEAMARHAEQVNQPLPTPIVTSPAAAAALQRRQELIQQGQKPEPGRTGPRKF
jgi:hypothetical protein